MKTVVLLLLPFLLLAVAGLIASLTTHLALLVGLAPPFPDLVDVLRIGIFVVMAPAVLISNRVTRDFKERDHWRATLRGAPPWMRPIPFAFMAYSIVLFVYVAIWEPSTGAGRLSVSGLRGAFFFSGFDMFFYAMTVTILYSAIKVSFADPYPRCALGHPIPPAAAYCADCGERIDREPMIAPAARPAADLLDRLIPYLFDAVFLLAVLGVGITLTTHAITLLGFLPPWGPALLTVL